MTAAPSLPPATREAILEAAARIFAQEGYRAATMQAIASEAGFTPPTVYSHFGSKRGLFEALVEELVSDLFALLERELPEGLGLAESLELRVRALLELAARRRPMFTLLVLRPYDLPELEGHADDEVRLDAYWEALFEAHADELGDRTPHEAGLVMEGVLYAFTKDWMRSDAPSLAPKTRRVVELVLAGVCA